VNSEFQLLTRLLVAAALAGLLGWERERARKSAGFRTHMLVGIASALYTTIGQLSVAEIPPTRRDSVPTRSARYRPWRSASAFSVAA
jgi:uncharacterized membrane protein YhiD involved in acid resistance